MINFFIQQFFNLLDYVYINLHIVDLITKISDLISTANTYMSNWNSFVQIVYFILGKPFTMLIITTGSIVIVAKIIMAIVNLVGQFIP